MRSIVTDPNTGYIFVTEFDALGGILELLLNQTCLGLVPTITPSPSSASATMIKSTKSTTDVATTLGLIFDLYK